MDAADNDGTERLAGPVTTLYWHFIAQHCDTLAGNPRTTMRVKSFDRIGADERVAIDGQAARTLDGSDAL